MFKNVSEGWTVCHEGSTNLSLQENLPLGEWELALLNCRSGFGKPVCGNSAMEVERTEGQLHLQCVREHAMLWALCMAMRIADKDPATVGLSLSQMFNQSPVSPHLPTVPLTSQLLNESCTLHMVSDIQSSCHLPIPHSPCFPESIECKLTSTCMTLISVSIFLHSCQLWCQFLFSQIQANVDCTHFHCQHSGQAQTRFSRGESQTSEDCCRYLTWEHSNWCRCHLFLNRVP